MHMSPRGFGWDASAGDDHAKGMGCKLTARRLIEGSVYADGISVDQHIANAVNPAGTPSLTLMAGWRADGVLGNISYSGSNAPVLAENNPRLAYLDLVGLGNLDDDELAMFTARRQSVLDLVQTNTAPCSRGGSPRPIATSCNRTSTRCVTSRTPSTARSPASWTRLARRSSS
jgi:hypothetical protein